MTPPARSIDGWSTPLTERCRFRVGCRSSEPWSLSRRPVNDRWWARSSYRPMPSSIRPLAQWVPTATVSRSASLRGRALADCIVAAPEIQKFRVAGLEEGYERLGRVVKYFRGNADCWMHAMAARGAFDAVVEFSLNRWDIAATEVIVEEAGGHFYTRPSKSVQGKYDIVFGSPAAADEIVKLLDFEPS